MEFFDPSGAERARRKKRDAVENGGQTFCYMSGLTMGSK